MGLAGYVETQVPGGDFKDPLGWGASDEEFGYGIDMQNKELAHGRLAMSTVLTLWLYDFFSGLAPSDLIRTPSPQYVIFILGMFLVWSQNVSNQMGSEAAGVPKLSERSLDVEFATLRICTR